MFHWDVADFVCVRLQVAIVEALISKGANVVVGDSAGNTALVRCVADVVLVAEAV